MATWAAPGRAADLVLMKDGTSTVYMVETYYTLDLAS